MLAAPLAALALWLALPDSPVTVALLAIALLFAVFMGVATSCARASSTRRPSREPVTPPSTEKG
jgi:hypothetical protein